MEVVNVEARTWEVMRAKFEAFAERVEALCRNTGDKRLQKWLENQEVCQILNISKCPWPKRPNSQMSGAQYVW